MSANICKKKTTIIWAVASRQKMKRQRRRLKKFRKKNKRFFFVIFQRRGHWPNKSVLIDRSIWKAEGKCWGKWSGRGSNLLPLAQRSKQVVFHFCCSLCLKLGSCKWNVGSWYFRGLRLVHCGTSEASQPHVNPPKLRSQRLILQIRELPLLVLKKQRAVC